MSKYKIFIALISLIISQIIFASTQQTKINLVLDWFVNPDHAPIFVAQEEGFFKANGLSVNIIQPANPDDAPKLIAAKIADIGISYDPQYAEYMKQNLPLAKVGVLIATPLNCLITLKSGSIHKIEDLKGKRIGYGSSVSEVSRKMLQTMFAAHGLSLKDVELINVHYGLVQALLSGKIDAFIDGMRNFEPIEMELANQSARIFYPEENGVQSYNELIFITHEQNKDSKWTKAFINSINQGTSYLLKHPASSWEKFAKQYPTINNELNKRAWFATLPKFKV